MGTSSLCSKSTINISDSLTSLVDLPLFSDPHETKTCFQTTFNHCSLPNSYFFGYGSHGQLLIMGEAVILVPQIDCLLHFCLFPQLVPLPYVAHVVLLFLVCQLGLPRPQFLGEFLLGYHFKTEIKVGISNPLGDTLGDPLDLP